LETKRKKKKQKINSGESRRVEVVSQIMFVERAPYIPNRDVGFCNVFEVEPPPGRRSSGCNATMFGSNTTGDILLHTRIRTRTKAFVCLNKCN
jgi:hypothetical protein